MLTWLDSLCVVYLIVRWCQSVTMRLRCLRCSPPPFPAAVVWSSDFGSLRFSQTALTGASPAEQDQPWSPEAASELLSGPVQHMNNHAVI